MVSESDVLSWVQDWVGASKGVCEYKKQKLLCLRRGEKIFLVIESEGVPLRMELRCDERLGRLLQERYESVMAGRILGRNGIEVICSGQLTVEELRDLVRHAYEQTL